MPVVLPAVGHLHGVEPGDFLIFRNVRLPPTSAFWLGAVVDGVPDTLWMPAPMRCLIVEGVNALDGFFVVAVRLAVVGELVLEGPSAAFDVGRVVVLTDSGADVVVAPAVSGGPVAVDFPLSPPQAASSTATATTSPIVRARPRISDPLRVSR